MYSARIMTDLNSDVTDPSKMITANQATIWLGVVSFVTTCFSSFTVRRFKRRTLLIAGEFLMSLFLGLVALSAN